MCTCYVADAARDFLVLNVVHLQISLVCGTFSHKGVCVMVKENRSAGYFHGIGSVSRMFVMHCHLLSCVSLAVTASEAR